MSVCYPLRGLLAAHGEPGGFEEEQNDSLIGYALHQMGWDGIGWVKDPCCGDSKDVLLRFPILEVELKVNTFYLRHPKTKKGQLQYVLSTVTIIEGFPTCLLNAVSLRVTCFLSRLPHPHERDASQRT